MQPAFTFTHSEFYFSQQLYSHSDYSKFENDRPSDPGKSDWTDPRKNENMTDKILKTATVRVCDNVKKNIIYCAFKWLIQHTSVEN